jgi:chromosome segregation ATPase
MKDEKNKLKYMQNLVREKQTELGGALQYSKIQDMENRLLELKKEAFETDKKLLMLENLRKK